MEDDECPTIAVFGGIDFANIRPATAASVDDDAVIVLGTSSSTTAQRTMPPMNMQPAPRSVIGPPPLVRIPVAQSNTGHIQTVQGQVTNSIPNLQPMVQNYVDVNGLSRIPTSRSSGQISSNDRVMSTTSLLQLREHVFNSFNQFKSEKKFKEGMFFLQQASQQEPRLEPLCSQLRDHLLKQFQQSQVVSSQQCSIQQAQQEVSQQQITNLQQHQLQQQLRLQQQQNYIMESAANRMLTQPQQSPPDYHTAVRQNQQQENLDQLLNKQIINEFQKRLNTNRQQSEDQLLNKQILNDFQKRLNTNRQQSEERIHRPHPSQQTQHQHHQQERGYQNVNPYQANRGHQLPAVSSSSQPGVRQSSQNPNSSQSISSILHQQLQQRNQYTAWHQQQSSDRQPTQATVQYRPIQQQQQQQRQQNPVRQQPIAPRQPPPQQLQQNQLSRQAIQQQKQRQETIQTQLQLQANRQARTDEMLKQQRIQKQKDDLKRLVAQQKHLVLVQQQAQQKQIRKSSLQPPSDSDSKSKTKEQSKTIMGMLNQKYAVFNVFSSNAFRHRPIVKNQYKPSLNVGLDCFIASIRVKEYSEEDNRSEIIEREHRLAQEQLEAEYLEKLRLERIEREKISREERERQDKANEEAAQTEMLKLAEEISLSRSEIEEITQNDIAELTKLGSEDIVSERSGMAELVTVSVERTDDNAADMNTVTDSAENVTCTGKEVEAKCVAVGKPHSIVTDVTSPVLDMNKVIMDSVEAIREVINESADPIISSQNPTKDPVNFPGASCDNTWLCCPICKSLNVNFFSCNEKNMLQHIMIEHNIQDVECANSLVTAIEFPKCFVKLNRLPLTNGNNAWRVSDCDEDYDYCEEDFYEIECQYCDTIFVRKASYNRHIRGCRKKAMKSRRNFVPPATRGKRMSSRDSVNNVAVGDSDYEYDQDVDVNSSIISESSDLDDFVVPDDYESTVESQCSTISRESRKKKRVKEKLQMLVESRKKRSRRQASNSSEISSKSNQQQKRRRKKRKAESEDDMSDFDVDKKPKRKKRKTSRDSSEKTKKRIIRPLDSSSDDSENEFTSTAPGINGRNCVTSRIKTRRSSSTTTKEADKENLKNKSSTANGDCLDSAPLKLTISVGGKQGPTIELNPKRDVKTPPIKIKFSDLRSPYASAELTRR